MKDHISNTNLEKGDHYYIQTQHKDFFPLQPYSKKTLRENVPKSARKYKRNVLMPPGYPIILLKSNLFNMAAVSVKRSIRASKIYRMLITRSFAYNENRHELSYWD